MAVNSRIRNENNKYQSEQAEKSYDLQNLIIIHHCNRSCILKDSSLYLHSYVVHRSECCGLMFR